MSEVRIAAEARTEFGKGAARRTRRAGKIPAVLYGHGQDPQHVSLPAHEFATALRHGGANILLSLQLEGGAQLALPRQIQRDPVRGDIEHVDLLVVRRGEKVTIPLPVAIVGEVAVDGLLNTELTAIDVEAEATHLPEGVEYDITGLEIGGRVTAADIKLPSGATLVTDPDATVVTILAAPTAEALDAELAEAEAEAGIEHAAPESETDEPAEAEAEAEPAAAE